jgi:hypothetical protein
MLITKKLISEFLPLCSPYLHNFTTGSQPTDWIGTSLELRGFREALVQALYTPPTCTKYLVAYLCGFITKVYNMCDVMLEHCSGLGITCSQNTTSFVTKHVPSVIEDIYINNPQCPLWAGVTHVEPALGMGCSAMCPPYGVYDSELLRAFDYTSKIAIVPVTFLIFLLLVSQCFSYKYWFKYPRNYIFSCTVSAFILALGFVIPLIAGGVQEFGCTSKTQGNTGNNGYCNTNAWFIYIGSWMQTILLFIVMFNIVLILGLKGWISRHQKGLHIICYSCIIIPPAVILPVMQGTNNIGFSSGSNLCLFKTATVLGVPNGWEFWFLILPYSCSIIMTFLSLIPISIMLYRRDKTLVLTRQWRLLCFAIAFGSNSIISIVPSWTGILQANYNQKVIEDYYTCLTLQKLQQLTPLLSAGQTAITCKEAPLAFSWFLNYYGQSLPAIILSLELIIFFGAESFRENRRRFYLLGLGSRTQSAASGMRVTYGQNQKSDDSTNPDSINPDSNSQVSKS